MRPTGALTRILWVLALVLALAVSGCVHIGPQTIIQDRLAYNQALATTWKEQTLLNIVKLRYADTPFFVDVAQIVAGYTMANTAGTELSVQPDATTTRFSQLLGASLSFQQGFSDRPTISYAPQTNSKFIHNLAIPLPPNAVLYLMQAGYPVDVVFDLTVDSINGLQNTTLVGQELKPADPDFRRICQILRRAQISGHIGMRIEVDNKEKKEALVMSIQDPEIDPTMAAELAEGRRLLRLDPNQRDLKVVYGSTARSPGEIAIMTRSVFRILTNLSSFVQVPEADLVRGSAVTLGMDTQSIRSRFTVRSGCKKPDCPFTAVCYHGTWFWIDDTDLESKRTMAYLMVLLALADVGSKETVPFLTIQAN